jgi:hypothetical protein
MKKEWKIKIRLDRSVEVQNSRHTFYGVVCGERQSGRHFRCVIFRDDESGRWHHQRIFFSERDIWKVDRKEIIKRIWARFFSSFEDMDITTSLNCNFGERAFT